MRSTLLPLVLGCSVLTACAGDHSARSSAVLSQGRDKVDTPTLSFVSATQTSITIHVCAGETGAAAGFSLHWTTEEDFLANGWDGDLECEASYSGVYPGSSYDLDPNGCVDVTVSGAECGGALACGTTYAFRVFAHNIPGPDGLGRSDFSDATFFDTAACEGCTLTQGYWKNHEDAWPVASLTLGTVEYTAEELLAILHEPVRGNGLVSLAHQLIAAKLNVASGAPSIDAIGDADALIGDLVVPPIGDGSLAPSQAGALGAALDAYNNGESGVAHCEEDGAGQDD